MKTLKLHELIKINSQNVSKGRFLSLFVSRKKNYNLGSSIIASIHHLNEDLLMQYYNLVECECQVYKLIELDVRSRILSLINEICSNVLHKCDTI